MPMTSEQRNSKVPCWGPCGESHRISRRDERGVDGQDRQSHVTTVPTLVWEDPTAWARHAWGWVAVQRVPARRGSGPAARMRSQEGEQLGGVPGIVSGDFGGLSEAEVWGLWNRGWTSSLSVPDAENSADLFRCETPDSPGNLCFWNTSENAECVSNSWNLNKV